MAEFYFQRPGNEPAFNFHRAGYDVWLANNRGVWMNDKPLHVTLKKDDPQYWHFSWEEMGAYDVPAFIDFIS